MKSLFEKMGGLIRGGGADAPSSAGDAGRRTPGSAKEYQRYWAPNPSATDRRSDAGSTDKKRVEPSITAPPTSAVSYETDRAGVQEITNATIHDDATQLTLLAGIEGDETLGTEAPSYPDDAHHSEDHKEDQPAPAVIDAAPAIDTERATTEAAVRAADEDEPIDFDEEWYLSVNPDVARAVREGRENSGLEHYRRHGRREGRYPTPQPGWIAQIAADGTKQYVRSKGSIDPSLPDAYRKHNGDFYLAPSELSVSPVALQKVAIIGSCMTEAWSFHKKNPSQCAVDLILVNNLSELPAVSPDVIRSYDFLVLQLHLPAILPGRMIWELPYDDVDGHARAFERACAHLEIQLKLWMEWNEKFGVTTFVTNFFSPQHNLMGRLLPRFDLRNPEYFVQKLNEHLEGLTRQYKNAYIVDIDRISASLGRRYIQDDGIALTAHGSVIGFAGPNTSRMEPLAPMNEHYELRWHPQLPNALWNEFVAMYRTIRQIDSVKLVVLDLDDTLWNGVSGDMADVGPGMIEGWPIGLAEALLYLKKRGILLAIISKNEEERIRQIWPKIFGNMLSLDDFAAIRINWQPKIENMRDILEIMNLLPRSVVFVDDNPVERAGMLQAFPDMRILGRHPYYLRRALLWAPETQVASISDESARRTEMIQAQFEREATRTEMSRDDFLREAAPKVSLFEIDSTDHPRFARALELINKTNQFNTTGRRWKIEDCLTHFAGGGRFFGFEVTDQFTAYGLVGVVVLSNGHIDQWVMSCRVLGYHVEQAVMAVIIEQLRAEGATTVAGALVETDVNFPCRDLFARCGFDGNGEEWVLDSGIDVPKPSHVEITRT